MVGIFNVFYFVTGSSGFSISEDRGLRKDVDKTLLNLITGIYSTIPYKTDEESSQKRGQEWAIAYGKRASPGWTISYGKRDILDEIPQYSKSEPRYIISKRDTPFAETGRNWNFAPNKRQQGWHIAYGKRFATPLYRR